MNISVILISEVSAGIDQAHGQRAVPVWTVAETCAGVFWPHVGWPQEDLHYQDKGI
jgi:hypothetical protein